MIRTGLLMFAILLAPKSLLTAADDSSFSSLARRSRSSIAVIKATIRCSNGIGTTNVACRMSILSQTSPEAFVKSKKVLGNEDQENPLSMKHGHGFSRYFPIAMKLRSLAHERAPQNAVGANNLGLIVHVCGRVTSVGDDYIYIDDGSTLIDGTYTNSGNRNVGVRVICWNASDWKQGEFVSVIGISSYFETGDGKLARCVRTRSLEDMIKLQAASQVSNQPQYGFITPLGLNPLGLKTTVSMAK